MTFHLKCYLGCFLEPRKGRFYDYFAQVYYWYCSAKRYGPLESFKQKCETFFKYFIHKNQWYICNENKNNHHPINCIVHSQTSCKVNVEIIISQLNIPLFFIFINFQCICFHSLFTSGNILTCNKMLPLRLCAGIYTGCDIVGKINNPR